MTLKLDLDVMMEKENGTTVVQAQINVGKVKETVTAILIVLETWNVDKVMEWMIIVDQDFHQMRIAAMTHINVSITLIKIII